MTLLIRSLPAVLALLAAAPFLPAAAPTPAAPRAAAPVWRAGAARVVVTPTEPMYLSGFASREVPAERTAMDLHAKALALEDARGGRFVMVTLDLVEVPKELRDAVAAEAARRFALPAASLLLNCSHTHCGPELKFAEAELAELNDPVRAERCRRYNADLTARLVQLVGEALGRLEPVTLSYFRARAGFAMNRRLKNDRPGGEPYVNSPNPDGPVDHDVPVLAVERPDKTLAAAVFGYACHNTTMSTKEWHGDYAGHAQRFLEQAHPGVVALFMMGCGGDQNGYPRFGDALSARHGQSLATAVEAALQTRPRRLAGPLRVSWGTTRLDYQTPPTAAELQARLDAPAGAIPNYSVHHRAWDRRRLAALRAGTLRSHYDFPVQVVRFGEDLTLIGLAGETCVDYSLRLKRELAGPAAVWVAGYCNDVLAYIPSRRVLLEGGYEAKSSIIYWANPLHPTWFAESLEERIIAKVHELVR